MEDFMGRASQSAREYYPKVYGDDAGKAQEILYDYVEEHHLNYLELPEGVKECLDELQSSNMPMAVVSNKRHKTLLKEIEYLGFESYFQFIIGAGVAVKDKPSPDPLLAAIDELNPDFTPQDILYVGDTETDLLTAQNAKTDIVFIQSDKPRPDLIKKYQPSYHYLSFSAFFEAYRGFSQQNYAVNG